MTKGIHHHTTSFFICRLERMAVIVVKGVVQEKNSLCAQSQDAEPAAKLMKSVRPQTPADQATDMLRAKIDLNWRCRLQGKSQEPNRAHSVAGRASIFLGTFSERRGQA